MTTLTECTRCGRVGPQGELPGRCELCAPPAGVLEARQREVDTRHRAARHRAAVHAVRSNDPRVRHDVSWRAVSRQDMPHLFPAGTRPGRSLCGDQVGRGQNRRPAPGTPGCRRCALAAGWIESLSEPVTT